MGRFLERTGGQYIAAEDSGTSVPDLQVMNRFTENVAGVTERTGIDGLPCNGDPSPATAYGTFIGLKTAVKHKLGRDDLTGLKVAIQGVGNVGYRLAKHLKYAGAELFVTDIHEESVQLAVTELGATAVPQSEILSSGCRRAGAMCSGCSAERCQHPTHQGKSGGWCLQQPAGTASS